MMNGEIKYNFGAIGDLTGGLTTKWSALNERLDEIKSSIQPLVAAWPLERQWQDSSSQ